MENNEKFIEERRKIIESKRKINQELSSLRQWFDAEYRKRFEQYIRKIALNELYKGQDPKVLLNNLYEQAEINTKKINELEEELNNENK